MKKIKGKKGKNSKPAGQNEETNGQTKKMSRKERAEAKRRNKIVKLKQAKKQLKGQLVAAQSSTKSMGKFDRKAHKEQRKLKQKRRKEHSNFSRYQDEIERNMEVFKMVRNLQGSKKLQHSL